MTDYISRADAIEAVKETKPIVRSTERNWGKMIAEQHSKELVKALKALPSADAVDVAHDIPEYCSWSQTYTNMVQSAMSKESADAVQGEWIPCSDRLPSESGDYFCTIPLDAYETYTEVLTFYKGKFYEDDTDEWGALYHNDVLAWMPLPKPYKDESEVKE